MSIRVRKPSIVPLLSATWTSEVSKLATLLFKVGTLAIRTAAKPLANRFQAYVLGHPQFRQQVISAGQVCLPHNSCSEPQSLSMPCQAICYCSIQYLHKWEVAITRGAEGRTGKYIVGNMSEEKALEIASKAVSEGFIFTASLGLCFMLLCSLDMLDLPIQP